jgi:hypothetical protein
MIVRDDEDATPIERASALARLEAERQRRAVTVLDSSGEVRFQAIWRALLLIAKPTLFLTPLTADEIVEAQNLYTIARQGLIVQEANDAIAERISEMSATEAREFDPATAAEWP